MGEEALEMLRRIIRNKIRLALCVGPLVELESRIDRAVEEIIKEFELYIALTKK